ncbi:orotidine 5'-phosphate decarboxylase [Metabacillus sp. KIGAM252]|uniref:Orotidine 5'-phosphate decarboxylase n=1 Tax=Metabacillus flavus TaxID=2823519 RepID=A0ABS5LBM8_9BACI|nr:orotidine 5'-phosphate decarboxylase / HUMPS family protein [Metabacillus flavus]MBS2968016.1 orotidine 5'-phosphate decarboxylase [Metabacillus flavus]
MELQLALDRLSLEDAIDFARRTDFFTDYVEVGTSLIKEFGMRSVFEVKKAFPDKLVMADMKVMDNAVYESKLAYDAGADILTVMGAAPGETIEICINEAAKRGRTVMIDLLNTDLEKLKKIVNYPAVFCVHTSKDLQESGKGSHVFEVLPFLKEMGVRTAAAGGLGSKVFPPCKNPESKSLLPALVSRRRPILQWLPPI